ncbi:MAG: LL-diaminopimelate aminotransferase [Thermodesulfobacteriota bacterium]|nr:LL-diaminopimelate aminotransferase [Thermodesulfobacteriota bacterium]
MFRINQAERLKKLPPYLFKELDRMKDKVRAKGVDIIDLGVGDPDHPTPSHIVARLAEAAKDPANHQYPSYVGMIEFRTAVAAWYDRRFGVKLDPAGQVVTLIGSKEGIAHILLAFVNPGDVVLVPEPAYPVYNIGTIFAGGESYFMPLLKKNAFLPDLDAVPAEIAKRAKMMFINYPNNPTGAIAGEDFYQKVVAFAQRHEIIVLSDAAYSEMTFDDYAAPSFLQTPGAMELGLEFHSLSKTYNMTGWRIGWAAGRAEIVEGLGRIKSNIDSGAFQAVQSAGIEALEGDQSCLAEMRDLYTRRRDTLVPGLREAGLEVTLPQASFYLWVQTPKGYSSTDFTAKLLEETGIVCTPGNGFGPSGEGFVRFALTKEVDRLQEAVSRIKALKL